ncbi:MAG TPA: hypothetical protein VE623_24655 [Acidimicrobiales bacterium]|jgi:hypothetical protein|nr:hypothetical protein [Acidimicrobiales bacterium]
MVSRADLLALVDGAPGPLRTVEAALTRWVDTGLVAAVHEPLARVAGLDGEAAAVDLGEKGEGPARSGPPVIDESLSYVLVALPDRWRVVGRGHIAVSDGHQSWVGTGSLVTERDSTRAAIHDAGPIGACLYPGPLLGWLGFGDPEPDERAGRFCWTVDAYPRPLAPSAGPLAASVTAAASPAMAAAVPPASRLPEEFLGIEHRFWFEARTGIVLRHEGSLEGEPCSMTELTDVVIDEPIPADEFAPPPDAIVRSSHELLRDHLTELGVDPDAIDLDDPGEVRRALRQGAAFRPMRGRAD